MTAQVINFPANQVSQPSVAQVSATNVVSSETIMPAFWIALAVVILVISNFTYGTPGLFLAIGLEIIAVGVFVACYKPAASVQPQQAVVAANAVSAAPAKPVVEVSLAPSADVITKFFNDAEAFKWNYDTTFKFQADRKLYFRSKFKSLEAQANSPMLAKILNDFRAHHYDSAEKPVLANYL